MLIFLVISTSSEKNKCNIFNEKKYLRYFWYLEMSAFIVIAYF